MASNQKWIQNYIQKCPRQVLGFVDYSQSLNCGLGASWRCNTKKTHCPHSNEMEFILWCTVINLSALTDLNTVCNQMVIKCITEKEYHFLKEYCAVLKPLKHCPGYLTRWRSLLLWHHPTNIRSSHVQNLGTSEWAFYDDIQSAISDCTGKSPLWIFFFFFT